MEKQSGRVTGSRASAEPCSTVSALTGFDPARLAKAEELCRRRAGAQQGYFCKPGEGFEAAWAYGKRWAPKLGSELVSLERHKYYMTRAEAVDAAREWRRLWRAKLAAIATEAGTATDREAGVAEGEGAGLKGIAQ